jgi:endonuclease/exonuclease/phosphatase family metal-dependent hydrolase
MRIATWNIQKGLDGYWAALEALAADVITVQECGADTEAQAADRSGWTCCWQSGTWHKGLAVMAHSPYAIVEREEQEPWAVSVIVDGPTRFRFIGFWAMTEKDVGFTYTRQATRMIGVLPDDGLPTVVAGDFNASKSPQHLRNVERLRERGLVSAYHRNHGTEHADVEEHPTSYFLWQRERPHHMDFVFLPREWSIDGVEVGTFEAYTAAGSSDHVPVVVSTGVA